MDLLKNSNNKNMHFTSHLINMIGFQSETGSGLTHESPASHDQEKGWFYKETLFTRYQYDDGSLYGLADDVIQGKHPVRLDVVVPQDFIYLQKH